MSIQGDTAFWRYAPLVVGLLGALVFAGSLVNGFTFDDPHIVVENPAVTGAAGWDSVFLSHYWSGEKPVGALWRPLTVASYRLNRFVLGAGPFAFHLVNILVHGIASCLVFLLFRRLAGETTAALAALLFATHPIHTEAVVSIVGRAELLATVFVLAAWLLRDQIFISALLFALGMLSKENAIILPALVVMEDLMTRRSRTQRQEAWKGYVLQVLTIGAFLAARSQVVGPLTGDPTGPFASVDAGTRVLTAVATLGRGLFLMVFPLRLSADYSFDQIPLVTGAGESAFLLGVGALTVCAVVGTLAWSRARAVALGMAIYFAALLPVSNLLVGIGVILAERLYYLPSVGFCLAAGGAIVWLGGKLSARRSVAAAALVALVVTALYTARAARRTGDWFDQLTLFEATVAASPRSALAQMNLGGVYQALGRAAESEEAYRRAIAIAPHFPAAHFNLGTLLASQRRFPEAIDQFHEASRLRPDDWRPLTSLAGALAAQGNDAAAREVRARAAALGAPGLRREASQ